MKTMKLSSLAVSLVAAQLLWSAPVQALLISDSRVIDTTLSPTSPTYSSVLAGTSFDLTDDGVPGMATVNWANVSFSLLDVDGRTDSVFAFLGDDVLYGKSNPVGISAFGGLINGTVTGLLNVSGKLDYSLSLFGSSSVRVLDGVLVADVTSVPEPGTLSLLGAGLVAGWLGGRRRTRKQ